RLHPLAVPRRQDDRHRSLHRGRPAFERYVVGPGPPGRATAREVPDDHRTSRPPPSNRVGPQTLKVRPRSGRLAVDAGPGRGPTEQETHAAMSLSIDEVAKVALLARLRLSPEELATFTGQLSAIVDFVAQLQELGTSGVEPLAHGVEVRNV